MSKSFWNSTIATLLLGVIPGFVPAFALAACTPVTTEIVSDTVTMVDAANGGGNAVLVVPSVAWTASIPGASWIWESPADEASVGFARDFSIPGTITSATLDIAADNFYSVSLNGNFIGSELVDPFNFTLATQDTYGVSTAFFVSGTNTLMVTASNQGGVPSGINPAGLLFKLTVESDVCGTDDIGNTSVKNWNSATVENLLVVKADTGDNYAGGSEGGDGGNGGDVENEGTDQDVDTATTGNGGNGGNAGPGGIVLTGMAIARGKIVNVVNTSDTAITRCGCNGPKDKVEGDDKVKNYSDANVGNAGIVKADTGDNTAAESEGGDAGNGGDIENESSTQDVKDSNTGNGGNGGNGSFGGLVRTGDSSAEGKIVNVVNKNVTRILR